MMPARPASARPALPPAPTGQQPTTARRTALAVDLASCTVAWRAATRGPVSGSRGDSAAPPGTLVRRGRVVDADGCASLLSQLVQRYPEPVPAGGVLVACRPLLATDADQDATRRVLNAVFAP